MEIKTNGKNKQVFRSDWSAGKKHCYLSLPVPVDYVQHALLAVSDLLVLSPSLAPDLAKLADRSMFCICKVNPNCGSIAPYVSRISFQVVTHCSSRTPSWKRFSVNVQRLIWRTFDSPASVGEICVQLAISNTAWHSLICPAGRNTPLSLGDCAPKSLS